MTNCWRQGRNIMTFTKANAHQLVLWRFSSKTVLNSRVYKYTLCFLTSTLLAVAFFLKFLSSLKSDVLCWLVLKVPIADVIKAWKRPLGKILKLLRSNETAQHVWGTFGKAGFKARLRKFCKKKVEAWSLRMIEYSSTWCSHCESSFHFRRLNNWGDIHSISTYELGNCRFRNRSESFVQLQP